MDPLIIEVALNGTAASTGKPHVPVRPEEVARDGLACLAAGAAILHSHLPSYDIRGDEAVLQYREGWRSILARHPEAIIYGTVASGPDREARFGHYGPLSDGGMRMAVLDPGSVNLAAPGPDGRPGPASMVYSTGYDDIEHLLDLMGRCALGPSVAAYEPGFLRTIVAYERAGMLPPGTFVKLYFCGPYSFLNGRRTDFGFGLPPTIKALEAYLEILEASRAPWAVAVLGGCVFESGMAAAAIERGGHVRVGLEDFGGERAPGNAELVLEVVGLARRLGRPIATPAQAAAILRLPIKGRRRAS